MVFEGSIESVLIDRPCWLVTGSGDEHVVAADEKSGQSLDACLVGGRRRAGGCALPADVHPIHARKRQQPAGIAVVDALLIVGHLHFVNLVVAANRALGHPMGHVSPRPRGDRPSLAMKSPDLYALVHRPYNPAFTR